MQRIYLNPKAASHPEIKNFVVHLEVENDNLILALHAIENHFGYIPREAQAALAEKYEIPLARIYEVVTFYHYFRTKPTGKNLLTICNGTTCWLLGSEKLKQVAKEFLANLPVEKQKDFSVEEVRCVGSCALAPLVYYNSKIKIRLKPEELKTILEKEILSS